MEEIEKIVDMAFATDEPPEGIEPGFNQYLYNTIRTRVLILKKAQTENEIAMIRKFQDQLRHIAELAG